MRSFAPCDENAWVEKGVKPADVKQGALRDCWLVPVMATLAGTMPIAIKRIFVDKERSWRYASSVRSTVENCYLCVKGCVV